MKTNALQSLLLLLAIIFTAPVNAMFIQVDVEKVPIDRVLSNLTQRVIAKPNDFQLLMAAARLRAMAYSVAATNLIVEVEKRNGLPFDGYGPSYPPRKITKSKDDLDRKKAKAHLNQALEYYLRAQSIRPTNALAALGLGWCYREIGETNKAIGEFRLAVENSWKEERAHTSHMWTPTEEIIRYLLPLLHPHHHQREIKELKQIQAQSERMTRMVTPLAIPLQPNLPPQSLIDTNASVAFDLDGSAIPSRRWQWLNTNAAWIVHLPRGGDVTSGLQLFGNVTFWLFWENGFHALASLDDNNDGKISGPELHGLALWHDLNTDAISTPNEIQSLHRAGITSLDTYYETQTSIPTSPQGAHFSNGSTRPIYDLILNSAPASAPPK